MNVLVTTIHDSIIWFRRDKQADKADSRIIIRQKSDKSGSSRRLSNSDRKMMITNHRSSGYRSSILDCQLLSIARALLQSHIAVIFRRCGACKAMHLHCFGWISSTQRIRNSPAIGCFLRWLRTLSKNDDDNELLIVQPRSTADQQNEAKRLAVTYTGLSRVIDSSHTYFRTSL